VPTLQLERQVESGVRERGRRYYAEGAVELVHAEPGLVEATVYGTEPYDVRIEHDSAGGTVEVGCGCAYFQDRGEPCKHIWATLLSVTDHEFLSAGELENAQLVLSDDMREDEPAEGPKEDGEEEDPAASESPADALRFLIDPATGTPPDRRPARRRSRSRQPDWQQQLEALRQRIRYQLDQQRESWPADRQIVYVVDRPATLEGTNLILQVACRQPRADGQWGTLRQRRIGTDLINFLPDPDDRRILALLAGSGESSPFAYYGFYNWTDASVGGSHQLPLAVERSLLPMLCETGRCVLRVDERQPDSQLTPLWWDGDPEPWRFRVRIDQPGEGGGHTIRGELTRHGECIGLEEPLMLTAGGVVFFEDHAAPLDDSGAFEWIVLLRDQPSLTVPADQGPDLLQHLLSMPRLPDLDLPDSLHFEREQGTPRPRLRFRASEQGQSGGGSRRISAELAFDYEQHTISSDDARPGGSAAAPQR